MSAYDSLLQVPTLLDLPVLIINAANSSPSVKWRTCFQAHIDVCMLMALHYNTQPVTCNGFMKSRLVFEVLCIMAGCAGAGCGPDGAQHPLP